MPRPYDHDDVERQIDDVYYSSRPRLAVWYDLLRLLLDWGATPEYVAEAAEENWGDQVYEAVDRLADECCRYGSDACEEREPLGFDAQQRAESGYCDLGVG